MLRVNGGVETAHAGVSLFNAEAKQLVVPVKKINDHLVPDITSLPHGFYTIEIVNDVTEIQAMKKWIRSS